MVVFGHEADADFDAILDFIGRDNPFRAISFVDELQDKAAAVLPLTPYAGRQESIFRILPVGRDIVVYRVDEEQALATVLMVSEGHRDWHALPDTRR